MILNVKYAKMQKNSSASSLLYGAQSVSVLATEREQEGTHNMASNSL